MMSRINENAEQKVIFNKQFWYCDGSPHDFQYKIRVLKQAFKFIQIAQLASILSNNSLGHIFIHLLICVKELYYKSCIHLNPSSINIEDLNIVLAHVVKILNMIDIYSLEYIYIYIYIPVNKYRSYLRFHFPHHAFLIYRHIYIYAYILKRHGEENEKLGWKLFK